MPFYDEQHLFEIARQFQVYGEYLHAQPCKIGHINETYTVTFSQAGTPVRYIIQKINVTVFRNPDAVMENLMRVTQHLHRKLAEQNVPERSRRALTVIPTRDGQCYYRDHENECWRCFLFIENTRTYEAVESPAQAYEAGRAFGAFQALLVDLPGARLHETIPDFHNTRKRFVALQKSIEEDAYNRAQIASAEIEFALKQEPIVSVLLNAHAKGHVPERITHNDTKFNNVMLDIETGKQMCVVDLDTVMPGLALYDFGDMVRTTTSPTLEDEKDLSKVQVQVHLFKQLARGYLDSAGAFLTAPEKSYLAFSGKLITFTIGIRFLTDFLVGDKYFRVHRQEHNLDRCRTQFKLVESIDRHEDQLQKFVDKL